MPQPTISGTPLTCKYGSLPLPNGQGAMGQVNLNDRVKWFWRDFQADDDYLTLSLGQLTWRGQAMVLGRDRGSRVLTLSMRFAETASGDFGVAKALLTEAGEQQLTFDNVTAILANVRAIKGGHVVRRIPFQLGCAIEFVCPEPYFRDISSTTVAPVTLNSGTLTNFNVTYLGSIFAYPVWTLTIPVGNTAPIAAFELQNVMSGDDLTIVFPGGLPASTATTITIDSSLMTVVDGSGRSYDVAGTGFPLLYPPAGQVQQIRGTLTPASGTATSCTIGAAYQARWLI